MNYTLKNNTYSYDTINNEETAMLKSVYQKWKDELKSLENRIDLLKMYNNLVARSTEPYLSALRQYPVNDIIHLMESNISIYEYNIQKERNNSLLFIYKIVDGTIRFTETVENTEIMPNDISYNHLEQKSSSLLQEMNILADFIRKVHLFKKCKK